MRTLLANTLCKDLFVSLFSMLPAEQQHLEASPDPDLHLTSFMSYDDPDPTPILGPVKINIF
jgi:hypothetical protein